jgi:hypothetical protein
MFTLHDGDDDAHGGDGDDGDEKKTNGDVPHQHRSVITGGEEKIRMASKMRIADSLLCICDFPNT